LHRTAKSFPGLLTADADEPPELFTSGSQLVAPDAGYGAYRPLFAIDATGRIYLVPNRSQFGPAWGVNSTDTLTPAIHRLLTKRPEPGSGPAIQPSTTRSRLPSTSGSGPP